MPELKLGPTYVSFGLSTRRSETTTTSAVASAIAALMTAVNSSASPNAARATVRS